MYELEEETVPREVAINEAVVLAKRYATEDAARLVNGILARVAREERGTLAGSRSRGTCSPRAPSLRAWEPPGSPRPSTGCEHR